MSFEPNISTAARLSRASDFPAPSFVLYDGGDSEDDLGLSDLRSNMEDSIEENVQLLRCNFC